MRGLIALFIWIGVPVVLMKYFDIEGTFWTILFGGVFGVIAMIYYGYTTAKDEGIPLGDPDAMKNLREISALKFNSDELINNKTEINTSSIDDEVINHANDVIDNYFLYETQGTLTTGEASIIKLSVIEYYVLNEKIIGISKDVIQNALSEVRNAFRAEIRPEISFAARANMGL